MAEVVKFDDLKEAGSENAAKVIFVYFFVFSSESLYQNFGISDEDEDLKIKQPKLLFCFLFEIIIIEVLKIEVLKVQSLENATKVYYD
jgi:hypothetical protein